jgi:hypothetical protein
MTLSERAKSYYRAYERHDPDFVAANLAPGFTFTSPFDDHIGREEYFRRCWPATPMHQSFQFVALMESGDQVLVVYDAELRAPNAVHVTGRFRNAELMIFEGDKLKSVEVFFGDPPNGLTRAQFAQQSGAA